MGGTERVRESVALRVWDEYQRHDGDGHDGHDDRDGYDGHNAHDGHHGHRGAYRRYCALLATEPDAPGRCSLTEFVAWWERRARK